MVSRLRSKAPKYICRTGMYSHDPIGGELVGSETPLVYEGHGSGSIPYNLGQTWFL